MKSDRIIYITIFMLITGLSIVHAQLITATIGDDIYSSNGSVSFTVGQVVYSSYQASGGSVTEGIQLPHETRAITGTEEKGTGLNVTAYPNPTAGNIIVNLSCMDQGEVLDIQIFDVNGKLIENVNLNSNETKLNMSNYAPGTYFIKMIYKNQVPKACKIIKK